MRPLCALALVVLLAAGCAGGSSGASPQAASLAALARPSPTPSAAAAHSAIASPTPGRTTGSADPEPLAPDPGGSTLTVDGRPGVVYESGVDCGSAGACDLALDIWSPVAPGPWPSIMLLHGGPGGSRIGLTAFAQELAADGAIVFNADYRDNAAGGGGWPNSVADVACAVRFAHDEAVADRTGSAAVTVVGHSLGGYVGAVAALTQPGALPGPCGADRSARVAAFVGLAGAYALDASEVADDFAAFFGPAGNTAGEAADPLALAASGAPPVSLLAEQFDGVVDPIASERLAQALRAAGAGVTLHVLSGGGHMALVDPGMDGPIAAHTAIAVARAAASEAPGLANPATPVP